MSYEIKDNVCEICGQQAISGILDLDYKIHYSCIDDYLEVYHKNNTEKINKRNK